MAREPEETASLFELAGLPAGMGTKRFWDGAHRVATPEETLDRLLPLMARAGVTRLGDLTGLDRLRLPVFAAYRPNSRSLAVFQGKGASAAAAKASALMEAIETYCAETAKPPLRLASRSEIAEMGDVVDVTALSKAVARGLDPLQPILWASATDIVTGAAVFVPFEIVHANYSMAARADSGVFSATTNGLASGNDVVEAVAHALYELVERDAVALWSLSDERARAERSLDLRSIDCPLCKSLIEQFAQARIDVGVWDITSDIGLPAFHCLIADRDSSATDPEIGSGCHPSRSVALMRALSEAAQSRATWISGARDDFEPGGYQPSARARRIATGLDWLTNQPARRFQDAPTLENAHIRDDLIQTVARLRRCGMPQALMVDLTDRSIGIPVARVMVPGLEGVYQTDGYLPGARGIKLLAARP